MEPTDFLPGWWAQDLEQVEEGEGTGPSKEVLSKKISQMFAGLGGVDTTSGSG